VSATVVGAALVGGAVSATVVAAAVDEVVAIVLVGRLDAARVVGASVSIAADGGAVGAGVTVAAGAVSAAGSDPPHPAIAHRAISAVTVVEVRARASQDDDDVASVMVRDARSAACPKPVQRASRRS
jgi:hypothetical protein